MSNLPETQYAVQLVGPDKLVLNKSKEVFKPGRHQILCLVEAVGLCFSDLKLLKQFSSHARKSRIVSGINPEVLGDIPSYVPGEALTVPGHEAVVRIAAVGDEVNDFEPGRRYLVQTDYRWLPTAAGSNAAFGYNFEGALQEYVLMDKRVITSPQGESMLLPVGEELSSSAVALVEPWACVEDAYASKERTGIKKDGQMLIVSDGEISNNVIDYLFDKYGQPRKITCMGQVTLSNRFGGVPVREVVGFSELEDAEFDDVIYFGSNAEVVEQLFSKVGTNGLLNIVLCGGSFGRNIVTPVGRVHYGGLRIIGTTSSDPAESMYIIPRTGEIRHGDKINLVGAGGPMGLMHVVRNICLGVEGVSVFAGDVDDVRLDGLTSVAEPLAKNNAVEFKAYNPKKWKITEDFDYTALMVPVPDLVADAIKDAEPRGLINIFAGIPATITGKIDLNMYIEKGLYFIGTSGSTLDDMKRMLEKVETGRLDTNLSIAAICGFEGATNGVRAVENRSIAGKIIVYPACKTLELVRLKEMEQRMPEVAQCLDNGIWTKQAEQKLLEKYSGK
jgi:threonine dehydrogenase-like Zn-dependent dehydrogenase